MLNDTNSASIKYSVGRVSRATRWFQIYCISLCAT